jgi:hypothetical protein
LVVVFGATTAVLLISLAIVLLLVVRELRRAAEQPTIPPKALRDRAGAGR